MTTTFIIEIEEDLGPKTANKLLSDLEEVIGKNNYSLYNSEFEVEEGE